MAGDPQVEKFTVREEMRRLRARVPLDERAVMESSLENRLLALPQIAGAATVLLFYSFGSEVETSGIAEGLHGSGTRLLLPFIEDDRLEATDVGPGDPLVQTDYGPKEPMRRRPVDPREIDAVVTPGLAFDRTGRRLGYGGGFYDRYLTRVRPDAIRIGVAFAFQVLDEAPADPSDERVNIVVTDTETIECLPAGGSDS
ncbi:MAG: 5-formyltetrahydrofolate cyclo-ligase [Actinomycetota bacterium]